MLTLPGYARFAPCLGTSLTRVSVGRFPNGELRAEVPAGVEGRRCIVIGSISPPAGNLERLTLVAHALRRAGAPHVTGLLPYLAYARQDRARITESLGLAWAGGLLRASGVDEIVCVDVHSADAFDVPGTRWRSLLSDGCRHVWIADTVLSRRRPAEAVVVPVGSLLAPELQGIGN